MKILILADIHGDTAALEKVLEEAGAHKPNIVICPGDVTDMHSSNAVFSQADLGEMIVQKLLAFNKNTLCVPGNQDPYVMLEIFNEYGVNIHGRTRKVHNMMFAGWGGAQTPFNTLFEPSDEEVKAALHHLKDKTAGNEFVLVIHEPPINTKLDMTGGKHVGSPLIRAFIEETKPILAISAHIHESGATDAIGKTKLIYPGPVFEGNYGIVELDNGACECKIYKTKV